jgi:DNA-3-methyladenine glycosylase
MRQANYAVTTHAAPDFLAPAPDLARALIGAEFTTNGVGGVIVETEAYTREDPASHSFRGLTPRNSAMFGPSGRAYVYRSYGLHWCFNIVCGPPGAAEAVLVRALEPVHGIDTMRARRGVTELRSLCSGPGLLCEALAITAEHNHAPLLEPPFAINVGTPAVGTPAQVITGRRIGITQGTGTPWRFGLAGSPYVSKRFADVTSAAGIGR